MARWQDVPHFIHGGDYSVDVFLGSVERWIADEQQRQAIDLDPDFQRGHVWTEAQQIRFVEYLLRGGTTALTLHWNHPTYGSRHTREDRDLPDVLVLVDGKQRLTAVRRFLAGEIPAFGSLLHDYEDQHMLLGPSGPRFKMQVNNLQRRRDLLQWYLDMNAGGVVHAESELLRVKTLLETEDARPAAPAEEIKGLGR